MKEFLLLSLACAAVSYTIATTGIFLWLRNLFSPSSDWVTVSIIGTLLRCPWCLNHYVCVLGIIVSSPDGGVQPWDWWLVHWFALVGSGGLIHYVLLRAYEPVARASGLQSLIEQQKKKQSNN